MEVSSFNKVIGTKGIVGNGPLICSIFTQFKAVDVKVREDFTKLETGKRFIPGIREFLLPDYLFPIYQTKYD